MIIARIVRRITHTAWRYYNELTDVFSVPYPETLKSLVFYCMRILVRNRLPVLHIPRVRNANSIFDVRELYGFLPSLRTLQAFDDRLRELIEHPGIMGVRAWEYGKLLRLLEDNNLMTRTLLDVGPGASSLPQYLTSSGARVVTVDLPRPSESPLARRLEYRPAHVVGTVMELPFSQECFDCVYCISTIEHLDMDPAAGGTIPYGAFRRRTADALREMVRVLKKRGYLYLTTDVYLPGQRSDRWKSPFPSRGITGAYRFDDIASLFLPTLERYGCVAKGGISLDERILKQNVMRSNYRGRYFSTVSFWFEKR